jgi:hypothetical protein
MLSRISLSVLIAAAGLVPALADDQESIWRLYVADKQASTVYDIDPEAGSVVDKLSFESPAQVYSSGDAAGIFFVESMGNKVSALHTGIDVTSHGDHADIDVYESKMLDFVMRGEKPVHFVEHGGRIAVFFDDSGKASIVKTSDWIHGAEVKLIEIDSGAPHHGVAVPWEDYVLVSAPTQIGSLPSGINLFDTSGKITSKTNECKDVHGEASSGNLIAFGCSDGVLIVSGSPQNPTYRLLPYTSMPEARVGTLLGGTSMQFFLGNYGSDKLVLIDPIEERPFRLIHLPAPRINFTLDSRNPRNAYVFLADGSLHVLDVISGKLGKSIKVTDPYPSDAGHGTALPRIVVAGEHLAVTDPQKGAVYIFETATLELKHEMRLGGTPAAIAAVGATGVEH